MSNAQLATLALYLVGGGIARQDTQTIALKCFELAPRRFCWRDHPEYPSEVRARDALADAKKSRYGQFVTGTAADDWLLTPAGVSWSEAQSPLIEDASGFEGASSLSIDDARFFRKLTEHRQFSRWKQGLDPPVGEQVADAVDLLPDAPREAVHRTLEELLSASRAAHMEEIERYLRWLAHT